MVTERNLNWICSLCVVTGCIMSFRAEAKEVESFSREEESVLLTESSAIAHIPQRFYEIQHIGELPCLCTDSERFFVEGKFGKEGGIKCMGVIVFYISNKIRAPGFSVWDKATIWGENDISECLY